MYINKTYVRPAWKFPDKILTEKPEKMPLDFHCEIVAQS